MTSGSASSGNPRPVPANWEAFACLDFVNSKWTDHLGSGQVFDRIEEPDWWKWFANRWHLEDIGVPDARSLALLRELRDVQRRVLEALAAGDPVTARDLDRMNEIASKSPMVLQIQTVEGRLASRLTSLRADWHSVIGALVASLGQLVGDMIPGRLKVCANSYCNWMFYDQSRSGTRRWCEASVCGSLVKVRVFRAKKGRDRAQNRHGVSARSR